MIENAANIFPESTLATPKTNPIIAKILTNLRAELFRDTISPAIEK